MKLRPYNRRIPSNFSIFLFILFAMISISTSSWGYSNSECIDCHSQTSTRSSRTIDTQGFLSSVHGDDVSCLDCHQGVMDDSHTEMKGSGSVDCGVCHDEMGLHGDDAGIACFACHTRHHIYRASDQRSTLHWQNLETTCGQCHSEQIEPLKGVFRLFSFKISSHPKESFFGRHSKSMCIGCHQGSAAHGETTQINENDCYKCHMTLGDYSSALGSFHGPPTEDPYSVVAIASVHITAVLFIIFFFVFKVFSVHKLGFVRPQKKDTWPTLPPL